MRFIGSHILLMVLSIVLTGCANSGSGKSVLYSTPFFTLFSDSLVEGNTTVRALTAMDIKSNYHVKHHPIPAAVSFRLSVNGRDNEFPRGLCHYAVVADTDSEVFLFGKPDILPRFQGHDTVAGRSRWRLRVDMRQQLRALASDGYFATPAGDTIYSGTFNGLWARVDLNGLSPVRLRNAGDSIFEADIRLPVDSAVSDGFMWHGDSISDSFPKIASSSLLTDAVFNMSLADLASTDVDMQSLESSCMSVIMSLAALDPVRSMAILRRFIVDGAVRRQSGAGGGWPVVNSEVLWGAAAWAVFEVTADRAWLREAYDVMEATLERNCQASFISGENLFCGTVAGYESTYPDWMDASGIYNSYLLVNNIYYARVCDVMADMAILLDRDAAGYRKMAVDLRDAVNFRFWLPVEGYFSRMIYGAPYGVMLPGTDNRGQALASLWNVTIPEMEESLMDNTPLTPWGPAQFTPRLPDGNAGQVNLVTPETAALWFFMASSRGNMDMARYAAASLLRMSALSASNTAGCDSSTGEIFNAGAPAGGRYLSAAANAGMVLKGYAGMKFTQEGIEFSPCRPFLNDERLQLSEFRYRDAVLTINVAGSGCHISGFSIDGKPSGRYIFPAGMSGNHTVDITLAHYAGESRSRLRPMQPVNMLPTPELAFDGAVRIADYDSEEDYVSFVDGSVYDEHSPERFTPGSSSGVLRSVTVAVYSDGGRVSFAAKPLVLWQGEAAVIIPADSLAVTGTRFIDDSAVAESFVETTESRRKSMKFNVRARKGKYVFSVLYANGYGSPTNGSMCAVRSLRVNGRRAGLVVMPSLGAGEWRRTAWSGMVKVELVDGDNSLSIDYEEPLCLNAGKRLNAALIKEVRLVRL